MPVRFRRTFTLFPGVKVNVSKSGMSITVGRKGFHLNFSKRGVRQTTGLPGSGISHTSYLFKNGEEAEEQKEAEKEERAAEKAGEKPKRRTRRTVREHATSPWGFFLFVFIALFFIYFGADAFGLLPPNLIANFLSTLTQWARQVGL
jgi:Fe2+ transport system protein B